MLYAVTTSTQQFTFINLRPSLFQQQSVSTYTKLFFGRIFMMKLKPTRMSAPTTAFTFSAFNFHQFNFGFPSAFSNSTRIALSSSVGYSLPLRWSKFAFLATVFTNWFAHRLATPSNLCIPTNALGGGRTHDLRINLPLRLTPPLRFVVWTLPLTVLVTRRQVSTPSHFCAWLGVGHLAVHRI